MNDPSDEDYVQLQNQYITNDNTINHTIVDMAASVESLQNSHANWSSVFLKYSERIQSLDNISDIQHIMRDISNQQKIDLILKECDRIQHQENFDNVFNMYLLIEDWAKIQEDIRLIFEKLGNDQNETIQKTRCKILSDFQMIPLEKLVGIIMKKSIDFYSTFKKAFPESYEQVIKEKVFLHIKSNIKKNRFDPWSTICSFMQILTNQYDYLKLEDLSSFLLEMYNDRSLFPDLSNAIRMIIQYFYVNYSDKIGCAAFQKVFEETQKGIKFKKDFKKAAQAEFMRINAQLLQQSFRDFPFVKVFYDNINKTLFKV